jgi:NAD(P)H-flavin reductase
MKETQAIIERIRRINDTHQHLQLAVDPSLCNLLPGQTLLAHTGQGWDPYLRAQWWPVGVSQNYLLIERPSSEHYEPGQVVEIMGPVGKPYRFRRTLRNVLLMAYDTDPTPLLMPVSALLANQVSVTLLLLGRATTYNTNYLPPEIEVIHGDADLNWANRVTTVGWADQVFVAVNQADEMAAFARVWALFKALRAEIATGYLFGVFQHTLPCGMGACGACMIRLKNSLPLLCHEGPAFDLAEVVMP